MLTKERLENALREFAGVEVVKVEGQPRFIATVVSGSFDRQDEAERQEAIWAHLRHQLPEGELPQIEFIFTDTPSERAAS
jgi:acid stress-induced BolA-like protein IbaG/YrbA